MSGIWIRSQNKVTLVNVTHIEHSSSYNSYNLWEVRAINTQNEFISLGEYSTKAKSLKVLDMIQRHIEKMFTNTTDENTNYHMFKQVFEMPSDYEV